MTTIELTRIPDTTILQNAQNKGDPARYAQDLPAAKSLSQNIGANATVQDELNSAKVSDNSNGQKISSEDVKQIVENANEELKKSYNKQLSFFVDDKTGKPGVRIIDTKTQKVIKQIPPEELLNLAARLKEQIGALVDEHI